MMVAAAKMAIRRGFGRVAPALWHLRPKPSLVILTYHRVLPKDHPDRKFEQPGMYVSPEAFEMHLKVLSLHFEIVDLGGWVSDRLAGRALPDQACSITFDDGWRDNFDHALPLLEKYRAPATVFLVSDFVGSNCEFWPNKVAKLLHRARSDPGAILPPVILEMLDRFDVKLPPADKPCSERDIDAVIRVCKTLSDDVLQSALAEVDVGGRQGAVDDPRVLLNLAELRRMSESGYVRFGSHGRTHTRLCMDVPTERVRDEVIESKIRLEELTGQAIDLFCYPNGDFSDTALGLVRDTYRGAVTTIRGWNDARTKLQSLMRVSVHEDIAADEHCFIGRVAGFA